MSGGRGRRATYIELRFETSTEFRRPVFAAAVLSPSLTYALAVVVIIGAVLVAVWAAWCDARSTGFKRSQYPLYLFGYPLTRVLWRARIVGRFELPEHGGAIIVCNHRGPVDPAFIALAALRPVHWMVAREYFSVPIFGSWLRTLEAVPTRRGGIDTAAVKQTIRYAREGELVGVFPEGKINTTDELLLPLRNGAVLMALDARVPIVPCYIEGSPNDPDRVYGFLLQTARTTLTVGKPIDLSPYFDRADDREVQNEITRRLGREIARLAGHGDFEPKLVERRRREHASGDPKEADGEAEAAAI